MKNVASGKNLALPLDLSVFNFPNLLEIGCIRSWTKQWFMIRSTLESQHYQIIPIGTLYVFVKLKPLNRKYNIVHGFDKIISYIISCVSLKFDKWLNRDYEAKSIDEEKYWLTNIFFTGVPHSVHRVISTRICWLL